MVSKEILLKPYQPNIPVVLETDASLDGFGAVSSHLTNQGKVPIAFASRKCTTAERNYSTIEREAKGILFGMEKFKPFIYGQHFKLLTDHLPLVKLFGPKRNLEQVLSSRMLI